MVNDIILSIGVPTYNRGYILDVFFEKLKYATEKNANKIEILISDNCSQDDTESICKKWLPIFNNYYKFSYHRNKINLGVARNINVLFERAIGNYFLFIGDDDQLFEEGLDRIIDILESDNPPSAIIQGQWDGHNRSNNIGYAPYINATDLFYVYGNAWAGVIDRRAALDVLQHSGLREDIEKIVWPQTVIGFLAMHSLRERSIYITDFPIGGPISQSQNIINKAYGVTSLYGLLKAASLVDNAIGENWLRKPFVKSTTSGFWSHIKIIVWYGIVGENSSSQAVRELLKSDYGLTGKFWAFILFFCDNYPKFIESAGIFVCSIIFFKSPLYISRRLKNARLKYAEDLSLHTKSKKRFGDWF